MCNSEGIAFLEKHKIVKIQPVSSIDTYTCTDYMKSLELWIHWSLNITSFHTHWVSDCATVNAHMWSLVNFRKRPRAIFICRAQTSVVVTVLYSKSSHVWGRRENDRWCMSRWLDGCVSMQGKRGSLLRKHYLPNCFSCPWFPFWDAYPWKYCCGSDQCFYVRETAGKSIVSATVSRPLLILSASASMRRRKVQKENTKW